MIDLQPSIVRVATLDDRTEIWRLFLQSHRENGIFPLAPEKVDFFLTRALAPEYIPADDTNTRGIVGVIGSPGALEAMAFIVIGSFWYSEQKHLEDFTVYVDPECRQSSHAKVLIEWMKRQASLARLPLLAGIMSNSRTEAKCRLYRRSMHKVGELFLEMPTVNSVMGSSLAVIEELTNGVARSHH